MSKHTPGPWRIERGGGHAYNRIVGSDSIQTNGWPEPRNGISNASYSDRVCENLGDLDLPGPAANAKLIAAAPELLEVLGDLEMLFDEQIYAEMARLEFDAPDDHQYTVNISAKQLRAISQALQKAGA